MDIPDNGQWIIDDEYNVHYKHVTDEEKEYFKWLCRMYNEGIWIRTLQRRQMMTILQKLPAAVLLPSPMLSGITASAKLLW